MSEFTYRDNQLYAENVALAEIADRYGTPAYVYSKKSLHDNFLAYQNALTGTRHLLCYSVKANSNLAVLGLLASMGAGFDIVSAGELKRVLVAGGDARKTVFSGVGKRADEIAYALECGIHCFNVESEGELERIQQVAASLNTIAGVSLRVNPNVDALTHPYISTGLRENKFGVNIENALEIYTRATKLENIAVRGIDCHIGSQLTDIEPFLDALHRILELVDELALSGVDIQHLDMGGGLGVRYKDENPPPIADYVAALLAPMEGRNLTLIMEPGRSITANAGVLLTRVEYIKDNLDKKFVVVDAGMNDFIRPALYNAWLDIDPVRINEDAHPYACDIVGPVCETADFFGKDRHLAVRTGDLLCVRSTGAYGYVMSSNYNSRPRPPEIMVDQETSHLIKERESIDNLMQGEHTLPDPK
jgi:diaminopimelate decarboxylase